MRTPKQTEASRANGAKSKGPVTPQGKRNSSRNSTRHGLLAETIVLQSELTGRFLELLESLFEEHQPQTPTEIMLVDTIAAARWRQDRIWAMQKVAFDHDIASCDSTEESSPLRAVLTLRASAESVRTHELLLRYEIALDRQISRSLLRLQQLQARELPVGELEERNSKRAVRTTRPIEEKIARHADSRTQETTATERTRQPHETIVQTPTDPRATRQPAQSTRQLRPLVPTVMVAVPTQSGSLQPPVTVKATQVTGRRSQKRS